MRKLIYGSLVFITMNSAAQIKYPATKKEPVTDDYFGTKVEDPYRWLEDDNSEATKAWVAEENKVTNAYLAAIPYRTKIKQRLEALWNYPKYGAPFKKGAWYYFYKNDGLQNQAVLYRTKDPDGTAEVFIDPNTLSNEGIAALSGVSFSKDGKLCAYSVAKAGSDWTEIFVMNADTRQLLTDKINWTKFGGVAWKGDDGFYYSAYDEPDEQSKLSKKNEFQ
ncbi:MAG TPA: S9 family peptidase, partial [Niabella sp.]